MPQTERLVRHDMGEAEVASELPANGRSADLPPGARVGDFVIGDVIASGGFGVVYRAEHAEHHHPAAVKVLHAELAGTLEAVRRFEREIEAIRRIRHPNVVDIVAFGRLDDGRPYFAMELLSGVDLETHVREGGRLSPDEALAVFEPLCAALTAAHTKAIIHRDFKASNVFLSEPSEPSEPACVRRVVLLDFGVAKLLDEGGPGLTTSRNMLGTPACMAPEQITGRPADARTDVYALGALAYFMLTGELPFRDASVVVMLHMHLYARPPCPSAVAPVSSAFDDVVARAMSKDAAERYPTADAFLEAFRAAIERSTDRSAELSTSSARTSDLLARRAIGLHLEIIAAADDPESPDDHLLEDMESILPVTIDLLGEHGFSPVLQTGNTVLLAAPLPDEPKAAQLRRRDAVDAALALHCAIEERPGRDERVHVNLCLHEGSVELVNGTIVGGEIVALAAWVPHAAINGVTGTPSVFEGLGLETELEGAGSHLQRIHARARS